jgi:preprotein translocase subunit SecB
MVETKKPANTDQADQNKKQDGPTFTIQRIYIKVVSYEAPGAPAVFKEEWKPEVNVDLQTKTDPLEENLYDVTLHITVTVKMADKTAFLIEVHQSGIFTINGFPKDQLGHALGSLCPSILYPYAREAISDIVTRGGFPQLLLAPVNFDALYMQHLEQQKQTETGK